MPQIWLTRNCTEEYWWRGFDSETIRKKTTGIYYDIEKSYLQNYDYNHTSTITFKHSFIHSDIHLFKSPGLHFLIDVSGMTLIPATAITK